MIAPCMNCPDRTIGCHGRCERYKALQAENEQTKAKAKEARDLDWQQGKREYGKPMRIGQRRQKMKYGG